MFNFIKKFLHKYDADKARKDTECGKEKRFNIIMNNILDKISDRANAGYNYAKLYEGIEYAEGDLSGIEDILHESGFDTSVSADKDMLYVSW